MQFRPVVKSLRSSDGTSIHAEFVGDVQKPCIVLVHGFNMSSVVFDDLFCDVSLLREVCMARYDLRGHGRSGIPEESSAYSSSLYADDFSTVMREFRFGRPILVTWSYGGSIPCDIYANLGPDILAGVVYIAGFPYLAPPIFPDGVTQLTVTCLQCQMYPPDVAAYLRAKTTFVDAICQWQDVESVEHRRRLTWLAPAFFQSPQVVRNLLTRQQDPEKLLEALRCGTPVLMLYGDADKLMNGEHIVREMQQHCADMEVHIMRGAGHAPFFERREEFVSGILRFVDRAMTKRKLDSTAF
ncbi:alpha/beta-hydrolase [Daedalea quercina L-15889]|uniref:Alpha/beta-hydrolase n=1 Tax=Daedalea quercina L-15889 TaxID=1314783 RepID=A0A165PSK5_9APHY|nr:alpha/beta-hydrolase [Daedalea quercina L-15889]